MIRFGQVTETDLDDKAERHRERYDQMPMTERDIAQILMVRSAEECDPDYFSPEIQLEALREPGALDSNYTLILKRAYYLFQKLPARLQDIAFSLHPPRVSTVSTCAAVFFLGILFNYLGPGGKVHILYNPVVLLLVWNIAILLILPAGYVLRKKTGHGDTLPEQTQKQSKSTPPSSWKQQPEYYKSDINYTLSRWVLRKIWFSLHHHLWKRKQDMEHVSSFQKTVRRYLDNWWTLNRRVLVSRFTRAVHILAIFLVAGALTGIYIRGLFFEYNAVWKSTFIHDPGDISVILNILFGLPSLALHGAFIDESQITLLLRPEGVPAAPWIHLFAMSTLFFVFPGRLLLIFLETGRSRGLTRRRSIDLTEPYYVRYITLSQEMQETHLQNEISYLVHAELSSMCASVARFTCDRFYDLQIVPLFHRFRQHGGRIRDLEEEITRRSEKFRTELDSFLENAQENFRKSLSDGVSRVMGKKLTAIEVTVGNGIDISPDAFRKSLDDSITQNMTDSISVAATAAVAAAAGTISGGFGKVLGIAIVSALLHTSGPVGFLIGAIAGLLLGGGASVLAKDRITDAVKNQRFPGVSTRMLLRESKLNRTIEQARSQVYSVIKKESEEKLAPHREIIARSIVSQIALPSRMQE